MLARPYDREHQQLRRVDDTSAQEHLPVGVRLSMAGLGAVGHTGGPTSVEQDLRDVGPGHHGEVGTTTCRPEVGVGRAPAQPPALGDLDYAGPVRLGSVQVAAP
jgi:hypothetical protein